MGNPNFYPEKNPLSSFFNARVFFQAYPFKNILKVRCTTNYSKAKEINDI